jgi:hypothetical protein
MVLQVRALSLGLVAWFVMLSSQALAAELKQAKGATRGKQAAAKKLESKLQQLQADMKNIMEVGWIK